MKAYANELPKCHFVLAKWTCSFAYLVVYHRSCTSTREMNQSEQLMLIEEEEEEVATLGALSTPFCSIHLLNVNF